MAGGSGWLLEPPAPYSHDSSGLMKQRKTPRAAPQRQDEEIVRLEDLTPREEPKGGRRKQLFGQEPSRRTGRRRD
jgi:hypothetical protein